MTVNDFFKQENTLEEVHWRVVAASVRGRGHEKVGQLCQDAHYWVRLPEGILVAAVADGAGSASLGKIGAIVAAQTGVETLRDRLATSPLPSDDHEWRLLINDILAITRKTVETEAVACQQSVRELASTLIIVVATSNLVVAAQIGDGVAVISDQHGNLISLTAPQFGEYINETTFLVSPQALETAQITLWQGKTAKIALLSDGLQMLALELDQGKPYAPFFSPLFHFVAQINDETEAKDQLVAFLRSPKITERTDDDLTLLLATLS